MSQSLPDQIKAAAVFSENEFINRFHNDAVLEMRNTGAEYQLLLTNWKAFAEFENARLTPLITALAECASQLMSYECQEKGKPCECGDCEAMRDLRAELERLK